VASNGVTTITGQLKSSITAAPAYSGIVDLTTGFGVSAAGTAAIFAGGTIIASVTSTGITINGSVTAASFNFSGTGAIQIPSGTTAQRPATPVLGDIRYNTTNGNFEGYDGTEWDVMSEVNTAYEFGTSVNGGVLTVNFLNALTGLAPTAADPVAVPIQGGQGALINLIIGAALSINTNAVGATLGTSNNVPFRFWIVLFISSSSGLPVLGLVNCKQSLGVFALVETVGYSATGISNAATSAGVIYCPNGDSVTGEPFKIVGYLEYSNGLATAGTYVSVPSTVIVATPGTRKPGDTVQIVSPPPITTQTTLLTTQTQTGITASIALTSAANSVEAVSNVNVLGGAGSNGIVQLSRGATPTLFGDAGSFTSAGQQSVVPLRGIDFPGTNASTTYYVYGKSAGGNIIVNDAAATYQPSSSITLKEIMS
jgi:hypothetical protein